MTLLATSAFAPDFTHTTVAPDVVLVFPSGTSPVNVTLASGTYRMWLAPSAGCYLRALTAAVAAATNPATSSSMSPGSIDFGTSRVLTSGTRDGAHRGNCEYAVDPWPPL